MVVVFPCDPVFRIFFFKETTWANISDLLKTVILFFFAAIISGLEFLISDDFTIKFDFFIFFELWP